MLGETHPPLGTLDQCALALHDMLVANTALKRLHLTGVPVVALSGVIDQLLAGLMVNRTLRYVSVIRLVPTEIRSSSPVPTPRFWDRVLEMLELNASIRMLRGFDWSSTTNLNPICAVDRALFLLRLNSLGRPHSMPGGDIPVGCWPAVLGRISAAGGVGGSGPPSGEATASAVLYHFLRAKTELNGTGDDPTKRARNFDDDDPPTRVDRQLRRRSTTVDDDRFFALPCIDGKFRRTLYQSCKMTAHPVLAANHSRLLCR